MTQTLWNRSLRLANSLGRRCEQEDNWIEVDFAQMEKFIGTKYAVKDKGDHLAWYNDFCCEHRHGWEETDTWNQRYWWRLNDLAGESWSDREWERLNPTAEDIAERTTTLIEWFWIGWEEATNMLTAFLEMCQNLSPTPEKETP